VPLAIGTNRRNLRPSKGPNGSSGVQGHGRRKREKEEALQVLTVTAMIKLTMTMMKLLIVKTTMPPNLAKKTIPANRECVIRHVITIADVPVTINYYSFAISSSNLLKTENFKLFYAL